MRVMAFEAHPDDVEFLCAGTLAKYSALGHDVAIACMTNGEVGSPNLGKKEIAALREQEAKNAAKLINAQLFWLGYPDEFLFNNEQVRLNVIETVRQFRPDVIITLDKDNDYHPDHTTTGQLVWDIHVMVTVPNIETPTPPCERIPDIYYMDTPGGINFLPECYVDISDYWDTRAAMLECHKSQDEWCRHQYDISLVGNSEVLARFRGYQVGCRYAEAFRKPKFFPQHVPSDGLLGIM